MNLESLTTDDRLGQPEPDSGFGSLDSDRGPLPLKAMSVRAKVTGLLYDLEVEQVFHNTHPEPIEAVYVFPLPPRAAVHGFTMKVGERTVEGRLQERGQARRDYDEALRSGRRAALAEEDRPDVFTLSVGNLLPGDRAEVRLSLSGFLTLDGSEAEWRFPLVVARRYIPGQPIAAGPAGAGVDPDTDRVPDASRLNPPVLLPGFPNPVRLALEVELDPCGLELANLRSSLHAVRLDSPGSDGRLRLRLDPGERLDRDFALRFGWPAGALRCHALVAPDRAGSGEGTLMVTVLPPQGLDEARSPRDVVFVLDHSGSMAGWKMAAARRALARLVDTLGPRDRFAVIAFDTRVSTFGLESRRLLAATDRNRHRAAAFLAGIEAEGGTELLEPLRQAVEALAGGDPGRARILFLVTDGEVGNEPELLQRLRPTRDACRIQAVGIGEAMNSGLLQQLAALTDGWFLPAESERRLEPVLQDAARRIGAPLVQDLVLDAPGLVRALTVSSGSSDLYPGVPLVLLARVKAFEGAIQVKVKGRQADGCGFTAQLAAEPAQAEVLHRVWARWRLRNLEDAGAASRELVAVSLAHGVLCRHTAFLAVDQEKVLDARAGARIIQPVEDADTCFSRMATSFECCEYPGSVIQQHALPSAPRSEQAPGGRARAFNPLAKYRLMRSAGFGSIVESAFPPHLGHPDAGPAHPEPTAALEEAITLLRGILEMAEAAGAGLPKDLQALGERMNRLLALLGGPELRWKAGLQTFRRLAARALAASVLPREDVVRQFMAELVPAAQRLLTRLEERAQAPAGTVPARRFWE